MAIDTLRSYGPKLALPLYTRITRERVNDYKVGKKYEMRIEDPERQEEKGGRGPYNYTHPALLVGKEEYLFGEVPDVLLAFDAHTTSRSEAKDWLSPSDPGYEDDTEVVVLFFLRLDETEEWVKGDGERIEAPFTVEDFEGNG